MISTELSLQSCVRRLSEGKGCLIKSHGCRRDIMVGVTKNQLLSLWFWQRHSISRAEPPEVFLFEAWALHAGGDLFYIQAVEESGKKQCFTKD